MPTLYIDPGAGSMLVQVLLAGLLAIPFLLRSSISGTVARVRRRFSARESAPRQVDPPDNV